MVALILASGMTALLSSSLAPPVLYAAAMAMAAAGLWRAWGGGRPLGKLMLVLVGLSVVRIVLIRLHLIDLSGDETHYWDWSRRLDWSFYSKPPGVAGIIRLGTLLFGDTPLGVRGPAVAIFFAASLTLYRLARRIYDETTAVRATLVMQIVPLVMAYGIGMTPDTPVVLLWLLALLLLHRAVDKGRAADWLGLGTALGLGLLCKYIMVLFYPAALLYLLTGRQRRHRLASPWPYAAVILSLLFLAPVLWWNSQHAWVNFRHDAGHANVGAGLSLDLPEFGIFLATQLGVISPVLLVMMVIALIVRRKDDPLSFWMSMPVLAGFCLKALQGKVQANWPLVGYLAGPMAFAATYLRGYAKHNVHVRRFTVAAVVVPIVFIVGAVGMVGTEPSLMTWLGKPEWDPARRLNGWETLGQEVGELRDSIEGPCFILSDKYMVSSSLAFYTPGRPITYCLNIRRRMNQFDIWPGFENRVGDSAIYVTYDNDFQTPPPVLSKHFASCEPRHVTVRDAQGQEIRPFAVWLCRGFKGMERKNEYRYGY